MEFGEWKKDFTVKVDAVIEAHKAMHDMLENIGEDVDEDEFLLFVGIKAKRIADEIEKLG